MNANYIPWLALAVSVLSPILVEWAKKRFGKAEAEQKQGHEKHGELMAENAALRLALAASEKSENEWQAKFLEIARREITLIRDAAAKDILISELTSTFADTLKCSIEQKTLPDKKENRS